MKTMKNNNTATVSVSMPKAMSEKVKAAAQREKQTLSFIICRSVEKFSAEVSETFSSSKVSETKITRRRKVP